MARITKNFLPKRQPTHQEIHAAWKRDFLESSGWEDFDLRWGPNRIHPPVKNLKNQISRRKQFQKDILKACERFGASITQEAGNFLLSESLLTAPEQKALFGLLDCNQINLRVLEHNFSLEKTKAPGPTRKITRFIAGHILSGLSLHRKLTKGEPGFVLMREFFKNNGEFCTWYEQNIGDSFMQVTGFLATARGYDAKLWAKALGQECRRAMDSWDDRKISKKITDSKKHKENLDIVQKNTDRIWSTLLTNFKDLPIS